MNIKKTANLLLDFTVKRLAEIFGLIIFVSGVLLLLSLTSYSPEDPNFIFPQNKACWFDKLSFFGFKIIK